MRDLEIRGAGNLLGAEQSGHMEAVGYDLYCKMLNEAVKTLQQGNEEAEETFDTMIDMEVDAFIPSTYIKNEMQKLDMYKRIAEIETREEFMDMQEELIDRFGDIPSCVNQLLSIALLKAFCHKVYITSLVQRGYEVKLFLYVHAKLDMKRMPELLKVWENHLQFKIDTPPYFVFQIPKPRGKVAPTKPEVNGMFENLMKLVEDIEKYLTE